jgi:hypothetical protein
MQGMEPSCHASVDLLVDLRADYAFSDSEIEIGLQSEPELGRNAEVFAQSQGGVRSDSAFPVHNSADAARWNSDFPSESIDADVHWLHELLEKNLSGMDRVKQFFVRHKLSLMIVGDLDVVSVGIFPNEANAPLIVNANAMLTLAVASQRLQAVARGSQQVPQRSRTMEIQQLSSRDSLKGPEAGNFHVGE